MERRGVGGNAVRLACAEPRVSPTQVVSGSGPGQGVPTAYQQRQRPIGNVCEELTPIVGTGDPAARPSANTQS
jgi:hypothetical protein